MSGLNYWLIKISRVSGYLLLILIVTYFITGYSMTGMYGMNRVIQKNFASYLHLNLHIPFIILLILHCGINIYFALKRWKIIK
jgi:hypothetical protein